MNIPDLQDSRGVTTIGAILTCKELELSTELVLELQQHPSSYLVSLVEGTNKLIVYPPTAHNLALHQPKDNTPWFTTEMDHHAPEALAGINLIRLANGTVKR